MQKSSSIKIVAIIFVASCPFFFLLAQTEPHTAVGDPIIKDSRLERTIGDNGKFLAKTRIVTADSNLVSKIVQARNMMKEIRRSSLQKESGPQTIEDAAGILSRRINMACPPTRCFEYEGVFYFSGGTTAKPVDDFSSGLAIKKGETIIYQWTTADKPVDE